MQALLKEAWQHCIDPPWVMGAVPATASALPTLLIKINPHSHSEQHLLYGGGYLGHDGGGRVEDGRGGRGSWQTAADVLVPDNTNAHCHDGRDQDGKKFEETFKNTQWRKVKQIKPVLVCTQHLASAFFKEVKLFC